MSGTSQNPINVDAPEGAAAEGAQAEGDLGFDPMEPRLYLPGERYGDFRPRTQSCPPSPGGSPGWSPGLSPTSQDDGDLPQSKRQKKCPRVPEAAAPEAAAPEGAEFTFSLSMSDINCPVCMTVGTTYFGCPNGHPWCGECDKQIRERKCPVCRVEVAPKGECPQQHWLERIAAQLSRQCDNEGCSFKGNKGQMDKHGLVCECRSVAQFLHTSFGQDLRTVLEGPHALLRLQANPGLLERSGWTCPQASQDGSFTLQTVHSSFTEGRLSVPGIPSNIQRLLFGFLGMQVTVTYTKDANGASRTSMEIQLPMGSVVRPEGGPSISVVLSVSSPQALINALVDHRDRYNLLHVFDDNVEQLRALTSVMLDWVQPNYIMTGSEIEWFFEHFQNYRTADEDADGYPDAN